MKSIKNFLVFLSLLFAVNLAWAQTWPTKPVTVIIPYGQGGSNDLLARTFVPELEKRLKVEVRIEYHVGANATVAVNHLLGNPNDGHTFMVVLDDLITGAVYSNRDYYKEFVPTNIYAITPFILSASATEEPKAAREKFLQIIKDKKFATVATPGITASSAMWIRSMPEASELQIVPYRALPTIWTDLRGGHVQYTAFTAQATIDGMKGGHLVPIMVSFSKRFDKLPDVPTFREMGLTNGESYGWFAWVTRKETSVQAQERFSQVVNEIIRDGGLARFDDRLTWTGYNLKQSTEFYASEIKRQQEIFKKNQHLFKQ